MCSVHSRRGLLGLLETCEKRVRAAARSLFIRVSSRYWVTSALSSWLGRVSKSRRTSGLHSNRGRVSQPWRRTTAVHVQRDRRHEITKQAGDSDGSVASRSRPTPSCHQPI